MDFSAICGLQFPGIGAGGALLGCWRYYRPKGAAVDEPASGVIVVDGIEKITTAFGIAGKGGIYFPALPFPENRFSSYLGQVMLHRQALSPYLSW